MMNTSLPADLLELQTRFTQWRASRTKVGRIPPELREAALALADRYRLGTICRVCRLHANSLRQEPRRKTSPATRVVTQAPKQRDHTPTFLALTAPMPSPENTAPTAVCRIHLARPDGSALTVDLPTPDHALLATLAQQFLKGQTR